jgi:hypothetical protein
MCFFHSPFTDSMTRAQTLKGLAALSALPVMPSIGGAPSAQNVNAGRDLTAIFGSTALIGDDLTPLDDATILIRGERIEAIVPARNVAIPASAFRIDATGLFTIPGLIEVTSISSNRAASIRAPTQSICAPSVRIPTRSSGSATICRTRSRAICAPALLRSSTSADHFGTTTSARSRNKRSSVRA